MIYRRGISIALLILSFLAVHLYGVTASESNAYVLHQQHTSQKATRFTVTRDIAKVLASGEGNSSEFLFQRIQHQQQQGQVKVPSASFLFCLFSTPIDFSAWSTRDSRIAAHVTGFVPVVYKLLYPKHWFW